MNFDTEGGNVLLLELSGQVTFDERSLASPAITDEDQLEGGHVLLGFGHLDSKSAKEIEKKNDSVNLSWKLKTTGDLMTTILY